jgi:glycosyltransferase involved in cell wall biosynthesis
LTTLAAIMIGLRYSALIRTFNSEKALSLTLCSLENLSIRPTQYIVVDSGSTDGTVDRLPENCVLTKFGGSEFNYADAINQGIDYVITEYVMIISAHTLLRNWCGIEYALTLISNAETLGAAYFVNNNTGELKRTIIDKSNGLWNTCSIIKTKLVKYRKFGAEVLVAEEQEWESWLFHCESKAVARISSGGMDSSANVNLRNRRNTLRKVLKEYVAIVYIVMRDFLGLSNLGRVVYHIVKTCAIFGDGPTSCLISYCYVVFFVANLPNLNTSPNIIEDAGTWTTARPCSQAEIGS